jgi:hypothetical protein
MWRLRRAVRMEWSIRPVKRSNRTLSALGTLVQDVASDEGADDFAFDGVPLTEVCQRHAKSIVELLDEQAEPWWSSQPINNALERTADG